MRKWCASGCHKGRRCFRGGRAALFQYAASLTADALRRYNEAMITKVTEENLMQAAAVHAKAWRASHAFFCSPEFVSAHTAQRQASISAAKWRRKEPSGCLQTTRPRCGAVGAEHERAQRMYLREGGRFAGERKALSASLSELQMTKGARI